MTTLRCVPLYLFLLTLIIGCAKPAEESTAPEPQAKVAEQPAETIIERANRLELHTEYVPPPDPMAHHTMGFACMPHTPA